MGYYMIIKRFRNGKQVQQSANKQKLSRQQVREQLQQKQEQRKKKGCGCTKKKK